MKSFLNYIGSKSRVYPQIKERLPTTINRYFEPFVGGGSVMFNLAPEQPQIQDCFVNDLNSEVILVWQQLKEQPRALKENLCKFQEYRTLKEFKDLIDLYNTSTELTKSERAALLWYFSKRAFNSSLIHKDGKINPGYSKYKSNLRIFNEAHFAKVVELLQKVQISNMDYIDFLKKNPPTKDDFCFIDCPYLTPRVKDYYKDTFTYQNMVDLYDLCVELNERQVNFMITLNDSQELYDLFSQSFSVEIVGRHSYITSGRNQETELIIRNYR